MHFYEHHIGDYAAATAHLSWDEDMAYTRLLRAYYHFENGIPEADKYRLARAATPAQKRATDTVLREFFQLVAGVWHQKRADEEIARYADKQRKASASANARWSQSKRNANALRPQCEGNTPTHHTPIPNQELKAEDTHQAGSPDGAGEPKRGVCVQASIELRKLGFRLTPANPDLLAAEAEGVTVAELVELAALYPNKPAGYVIAAARRQRAEGPRPVASTTPTSNRQKAIEERNRLVGADWLAQQSEQSREEPAHAQ